MTAAEIDIKLDIAWNNRKSDLKNSFNTAVSLMNEVTLINYPKGIADCNKILGYCYWRFSDYSKSLEHSLAAIESYRLFVDKKGEADALNSLGAVYMFQNDNKNRLKCNLQCYDLRNQINDFDGVSGSMNNIGETYFEMGDIENAEIWLNKCINYNHSPSDSKAWANHNLGKIEHKRKNYKKSESYFKLSLNLSESDKYDVLSCETLLNLCELKIEKNEWDQAFDFADKSLRLAKDIGSKEYEERALLKLSFIFEKQGGLKKALYFHKKYHEVHVAVFNEESRQKIKEIGFQYEIDKISKEAEIERLKKVELAKAYKEIEQKNYLIEQKNKDITSSIRYAKKIQQAFLLPEEDVSSNFPEHFILFKPKDIVSGDFYWALEKRGYLYIAAVDCTGHGVPGAFMSMLGIAFLNEINSGDKLLTPAQILDALRNRIIKELGQTGKEGGSKDGMDMSLIRIHPDRKVIDWAGAHNPLFILQNGEITEIKATRQSVGYSAENLSFENHQIPISKPTSLYLFTDGYADQFGGKRGKKFKSLNLQKLFIENNSKSMLEQKKILDETFENWRGEIEQIDDVCVIGVRL